jgi:hypothetical protein
MKSTLFLVVAGIFSVWSTFPSAAAVSLHKDSLDGIQGGAFTKCKYDTQSSSDDCGKCVSSTRGGVQVWLTCTSTNTAFVCTTYTNAEDCKECEQTDDTCGLFVKKWTNDKCTEGGEVTTSGCSRIYTKATTQACAGTCP